MTAKTPAILQVLCLAAVPAVLGSGACRQSRADPPSDLAWRMTFSEEFDGTELDLDKWTHAVDALTDHLSSRWPENVEIGDGVCRLLTKKETRGGMHWTTAHFGTKTFKQKYGYFEVRARVIGRQGINSGFWLTTGGKGADFEHFQIDVVANHTPNMLRPLVRFITGGLGEKTGHWTAPKNLNEDFHVYGLLWNQKQLVWYFDGRETFRLEHPIERGEVFVHLGTAVGTWAGQVTEALDRTSMDVDYVRVFEKVEQLPPWPAVLHGVQ